jgi:hypothetical protein
MRSTYERMISAVMPSLSLPGICSIRSKVAAREALYDMADFNQKFSKIFKKATPQLAFEWKD